MGYNGIILVDKPADWTSHDVVAKLRGILHERRVGHSGTLDPMATGLLTVFVGRATRAVQFAETYNKRYVASLRCGYSTDTQDTSGRVTAQTGISPTEAELTDVLPEFTGEISQIPPMYSAIKVSGKKLYELARKGETVERKPRTVNISELSLVGHDGDDFVLSVSCSKGTYIRTLCNDIGERLGCLACMSALRRTNAGPFDVRDAHTLSEIAEDPERYIIPVDSLFSEHPAIELSAAQTAKLKCGNILNVSAKNGTYRVYSENGDFLALANISAGKLKTIKSFFEVDND
ncbi:MAG: tRNA pseudouridine(55) synthase TruB [Oscillospiraceae bacterium]|nr:tRNA pseudouridine(55) synthase TruB [Oscillospiraceae bacterium]